jgi:arylformamidase
VWRILAVLDPTACALEPCVVTQPRTHIDISRTIADSVAVYKGDDPLTTTLVCDVGEEAPCRITSLGGWTTHFLTHIDSPRHFLQDGMTLDQFDLSRFLLDAVVVDVQGDSVEEQDVPNEVEGKALLFKTRNSGLDPAVFHEDHAYVSAAATAAVVRAGASLVGFDYLSVDRFGDEDYPAHRGLLGAEILILEGLDLTGVAPGSYSLSCLPLKLQTADGSPVRAVLTRHTE